MPESSDYLVEKLQLLGRAKEDQYYRKLNRDLIERLHSEENHERDYKEVLRRQFSRVLVAVDFSSYSRKALEYAGVLAEGFGSSIIAVHVLDTEMLEARAKVRFEESPFVPEYVVKIEDDALELLINEAREAAYASLARFAPARLAKYAPELRVLMGKAFERLVETAERDSCDLIVMGTHGRTGWSRLVAGSIAERVVRLAPCPVLTVKDKVLEDDS